MPRVSRPPSFVLVALAACLPLRAQVNDECTGAISVGVPSVTPGDNTSATNSAGFPFVAGIEKDLWYSFTAPWTGLVQIGTAAFLTGSVPFQNVGFNVYQAVGSPCSPATLSLIGGNRNYLGAHLTLSVSSGAVYYVDVGSVSPTQFGQFALAVVPGGQPIPGDHCVNALPIAAGTTVPGSNVGASIGGGDPVPSCQEAYADVWYELTAPFCGTFTVSTCGATNYDATLAVWRGSCGALTAVGCSDDACPNLDAVVTFTTTVGVHYFVAVGGFTGDTGTYGVTLTAGIPAAMTLAFTNAGAGTLGYAVTNGPPGGTAFTAITLSQGAYPTGWFYGLSIHLADLFSEWGTGYPFVISPPAAGTCTASVGPFAGLPAGLAAYAVTLAFPAGAPPVPTSITPPAAGSVP